ncbi:MAG: glutathione peroxidase [Sphingomonas oligoaromativorans]
MTTLHDFSATSLSGTETDLAQFKGKAVLVVNTASKCGFTPQYEGLEKLYEEYGDKGLVVLGFTCNQFGGQEPGDEAEIASFCSRTHGVTFPLHSKIEVNGAGTDPLYKFLKAAAPGFLWTQRIKWNFTKFLVDRSGKVVRRFAPNARPETLRPAIEALL